MQVNLQKLHPSNQFWLQREASEKNKTDEEMAVELLDRHIRALRFFDPRGPRFNRFVGE